MKKLITIFVVSLAITLVSTSVANASFSKVFTEGLLTPDAGVSLISPNSQSAAYVWDSTGNWDWDSDSVSVADTFAFADIGSAKHTSWTTILYVAADSVAAPPPFVTSYTTWLGGDQAWQNWWIRATSPVDKTFTLDYSFSQELSTDVLGEWSFGYTGAYLALSNQATGEIWVSMIEDGIANRVQDGGSFSYQDNGFLSVTGFFSEGDTGYVSFHVYSGSEAYTIPAPGAILLGSIGVCLVGWLRRRRIM